jgi:ribulose 1,5-bisphosphate carboxylase large subunit-like protein
VEILSGIAGNIFGMKALKNLRLIDATLPQEYIRSTVTAPVTERLTTIRQASRHRR